MKAQVLASAPVLKKRQDNVGNRLLFGNLTLGYYGRVPAKSFIKGDDLAAAVGFTSGVAQFSDTEWLKYAFNGKTLYVAKQCIRRNISWDQLNAKGLVTGTKQIVINGKTYKVRLIMGGNDSSTQQTAGNEWNFLLLRTASTNPLAINPPWDNVLLSDFKASTDTTVNYCFTILQNLNSPTLCNLKGSVSWVNQTFNGKDGVFMYHGWRPVLEEV